jgi:hypothetical protein
MPDPETVPLPLPPSETNTVVPLAIALLSTAFVSSSRSSVGAINALSWARTGGAVAAPPRVRACGVTAGTMWGLSAYWRLVARLSIIVLT